MDYSRKGPHHITDINVYGWEPVLDGIMYMRSNKRLFFIIYVKLTYSNMPMKSLTPNTVNIVSRNQSQEMWKEREESEKKFKVLMEVHILQRF